MVIHLTIQRHGYGELADTLLAVAALEGVVRGRDARLLLNYVNKRRDNFLVNVTNYFS